MSVIKTASSKGYSIFNIVNKNNFSVKILSLGGIVQSIVTPDGVDIVLGYDEPKNYLQGNPYYFGGIIGRFANRISNGRFTLNDITYELEKNDGNNHLHGGSKSFDTKLFDYIINSEENMLKLKYLSKHMENNYPGNLQINICYSLTDNNELKIDYSYSCDMDTIVNLTNHTYFNLDGHNNNIYKNKLQIIADLFTPNNKENIPTGEISNVEVTPLDFRTLKEISENLFNDNIKKTNGFDHNFIVNNDKKLKNICNACGKYANLSVFSNSPCMQFYSGNFIEEHIGKNNTIYKKHSGFCLETGLYPNFINTPNFPNQITKANKIYTYTTVFKFS